MSIKKNVNMSKKSLKLLEHISNKEMNLGNFLWSIREGEEMSQVEMAKRLNISRQYLCDIEHQRRRVSLKMAVEFADCLGYSSEQFVQLALQEEVARSGLPFIVQLKRIIGSTDNYSECFA